MYQSRGDASEVREERRPVTALFADLTGSTALAEVLDATELKLIVGDAVARMVGEVERLGGFTKDLAGDGLLAFFGAPVASEDDAERAVLAGLAITEAIDAYGAEVRAAWGIDGFAARVGITTGPVVTGLLGAGQRVEYAAFGESVNVAARLQSAAEPGAVLADEETRRLCGELFEWGAATASRLKDVSGTVEASQALRARPSAGKPRGLDGVDTPLVGRGPELRRLQEAIESVSRGNGGLVYVIGEAGIGKSRLVTEARAAHAGLWLEGRCVSYGEALPYWPFRDLIRGWLGVADDDPDLRVRIRLRRMVEELFGARVMEVYPYLCSLLGLTPEPDAEARLADLSPEALRYRTFEVLDELLAGLAVDGPLVVQLEDLHWADTTSVELVGRLLSLAERAAVLLVITQRDDRDHPCWRLREQAAREVPHLLADITLEPLSGDAELELLRGIVGHDTLPERLERQLLRAAEGNPFFLEESVRSLVDEGALVALDGGYAFDHEVAIEVPPTVERVVLARIDRLDPTSHQVVTAASTLGRTFNRPLLDAVLDPGLDTDQALNDLRRLELLRLTRRWPLPEYRFKHALIQDAAYRTLLPERRRSLHQRAASWLEARYVGGEEEVLGLLARHWLEAGNEEKAVAHLARAGDRARHTWALDEAIEHYRRLLPLLERRGERRQMALTLFKLALALHQALRFREANEAYAQGFDLWTPPDPVEPDVDELVVGLRRVPWITDPQRTHGMLHIQLMMALFDRLVEAWPGQVIVPSMAERWEISDDGLRYRIHLRPGLHWSDGTPITAHDVEFGVLRNLDRDHLAPSAAIFYVLEGARDYVFEGHDDLARVGVRATDDHTVEFRLDAPAPYFMSVLNRPDCAPLPRHVIAERGDAWAISEHQVVSGAFRRLEQSDERVRLERRLDGAMPRTGNARTVELRRLTSTDGLVAADIEAPDVVDTQHGHRLVPSTIPAAQVSLEPPAGLAYFVLSHDHPSLSQLDFRRALALALDRATLAASTPRHGIVATGGVVPPPLQGHTPDIAPTYDPDAARAALLRSGVTSGVDVYVDREDPEEGVVAAVVGMWEETLGLRFPLCHDGSERDARATGIFLSFWFPGYPDPEYFLRLLLHSDASDNLGGYRGARFDALIERARTEPDGDARLELFHAADRVAVAEDVAAIPLLYVRNVIVVKPWVHGWWEYGKSWSSYADLTVDAPGSERG